MEHLFLVQKPLCFTAFFLLLFYHIFVLLCSGCVLLLCYFHSIKRKRMSVCTLQVHTYGFEPVSVYLYKHTHTHTHVHWDWGFYWGIWPKGQPPVAVDSVRLALNIWSSQLTFERDNQTWLMSPAAGVRDSRVSDKTWENKGQRGWDGERMGKWNKHAFFLGASKEGIITGRKEERYQGRLEGWNEIRKEMM